MASFNDIATSLRVDTQLPLDHKQFAVSQLVLSDLGPENNLAFTYYDNLKVFCWNEKTEWIWREVQSGEEDTGLIASDFVYPNGVVYPNPGYEGKSYNFFPIVAGTETKIEAGTDISITGNGSLEDPYVITNNFVFTPSPADTPPLQTINESNGNGIILRGRNNANFGNVGFKAVDLSYKDVASNTHGATGQNSFAQGDNVTSAGLHSVTMGQDLTNLGTHTLIVGKGTNASAHYSLLAGLNNSSVGKGNTILGVSNNAQGTGITILGQAATIQTHNINDYNAVLTKPVLLVGNGTVDNTTNLPILRRDAFVVRFNGALEAPSLDNATIASGSPKTLITREYLTSVIPAKPYKAYVAILSQTLTSAPVLAANSPLENELSGPIVWTRMSKGIYQGLLLGAFTATKTTAFIQDHLSANLKISVKVSNSNVVNIYTYNGGELADNILTGAPIEIRVYN